MSRLFASLFALLAAAVATAAALQPLATVAAAAVMAGGVAVWRWPAVGVAAVVLAAILGEAGRLSLGGISFLTLDLVAPAVVALTATRFLVQQSACRLTWPGRALLVFWTVAAVSLLLGSDGLSPFEIKTASLHFIRLMSISGLFFVAQLWQQQAGPAATRQIGMILLGGGLLFLLGGVWQFIAVPDFAAAGLAAAGYDPHIGRLTGSWLDPNFAGGGLALLAVLAGSYFWQARGLAARTALLACAGFFSVGLLLTYSRSGLLALAVMGLVFGLLRNRLLILLGVLVVVLGVASSARLQERLGELAGSVGSLGSASQTVLDPTAQLRVDSWEEGLRLWQTAPILGVGYGTYAAHQQFAPPGSHAASGVDSSLLTVAVTTGWVGLFSYLIFWGSVVVAAWQARATPVGVTLLAGLAGLLVHATFVNSLFFAPLAAFVFLLAGALPPAAGLLKSAPLGSVAQLVERPALNR